jgi:hypothetical protein
MIACEKKCSVAPTCPTLPASNPITANETSKRHEILLKRRRAKTAPIDAQIDETSQGSAQMPPQMNENQALAGEEVAIRGCQRGRDWGMPFAET